jgi:hypothetical protein
VGRLQFALELFGRRVSFELGEAKVVTKTRLMERIDGKCHDIGTPEHLEAAHAAQRDEDERRALARAEARNAQQRAARVVADASDEVAQLQAQLDRMEALRDVARANLDRKDAEVATWLAGWAHKNKETGSRPV